MENIDNTDLIFMEAALSEAQAAFQEEEVPVGAVLVCGQDIVSRAHNLVESKNDASAHAELLALKSAAASLGRWRLGGLTLYSTVEPCIMCASAAVLFRVDRVVFGCWDKKFGGGGSVFDIMNEKSLNHTINVQGGIMKLEAQSLMQDFFKKRRRTKT